LVVTFLFAAGKERFQQLWSSLTDGYVPPSTCAILCWAGLLNYSALPNRCWLSSYTNLMFVFLLLWMVGPTVI
jgi:hypothetical protein